MSGSLSGFLLMVLLGLGSLVTTRNLAAKRLLLPIATAALAALCGLLFSALLGGSPVHYAVGIPLGMSVGLAVQHLLDYCRECGATHPLRKSHARDAATLTGRARCKDCRSQ